MHPSIKKSAKILCLTLLCVVAPLTVASEAAISLTDRIQIFEAWMETTRHTRSLPGISVGIVHQNKLVYSKGFGAADIISGTPITPDSLFSVASLTKSFTSIAIMQLVQGGVIGLNDPIVSVIPELYDLNSPHEEIERINLFALLTHTSGLPMNHAYPLNESSPVIEELDSLLSGLEAQKLLFPPNTREHYSNLGLNIAGIALERLTGMKYSDYVQEKVLSPIGMNSSSFKTELSEDLVTGYTSLLEAGRQPNAFSEIGAAIGLPSAGLRTSVKDLAQFLIWNFATLERQYSQVLDSETLAYMQRIHWAQLDFVLPSIIQKAVNRLSDSFDIGGAGLGFSRDGNLVMHGGGFDGYLSEIVLDRENEIGIIVLANSSDAPVRINSQYSISANLLEIFAPGFADVEAEKHNDYADYRNIYTEKNFFKYLAIPTKEGINLYDLLASKPMSNPVKLIPTDKKDGFIAPDHVGVYQGEFEVLFLRDLEDQITSMQLQIVTLDATL
tara:strand:+ start:716 stop:2215 length:1500 start_codon:yes stop_codon:yes gene_type:complete